MYNTFFCVFITTCAKNRSIQTSLNLSHTNISGLILFKFFLNNNLIYLRKINSTYLFICLEHITLEHVGGTISSYVTEYFHVLRIVRNIKYSKMQKNNFI